MFVIYTEFHVTLFSAREAACPVQVVWGQAGGLYALPSEA